MTCERCGYTGAERFIGGYPDGCPRCFGEEAHAEESELRAHVARLPSPIDRGFYRPRRVTRGASGAAWLAGTRKAVKPGRNDPCWCNSGRKYKKCHGR